LTIAGHSRPLKILTITSCEVPLLLILQAFDNLSIQRPKSLAPSSNAHTYRLLIVKELVRDCAAMKRCVHQQRGEIMKQCASIVNPYFSSLARQKLPFLRGGEL